MKSRIFPLNDKQVDKYKKYVIYCMEASQRVDYNHALAYAIDVANNLNKPVIVVFNLTDKYKHSNQRYYKFMLEGIIKLKDKFKDLGIKFVINRGSYIEGCLKFSKDACCIITDANYLKTQRNWRKYVADMVEVKMVEVETDVIVPVRIASQKQEPYAMTIRPKIYELLDKFLDEVEINPPKIKSEDYEIESWELETVDDYLRQLNIDKTVSTVDSYIGGYDEAEKLLEIFITQKLNKYKELRSDPTVDYQSNLSPYLHFGQISPVYVVKKVLENYSIDDENVKSFLNELVIWRELARNFCFYNPLYNQYEGIPKWAKETLEEHVKDKRKHLYSIQELEKGETEDEYWNAAQKELLKTGKMHNYMRMYWAKKIIEWTKHPKEAFDIACYLNDKYELDGRDPNGYAGISWCFGTHDRPWKERNIYGKVRYMSDKGLEKKFDIKKYVLKWKNG